MEAVPRLYMLSFDLKNSPSASDFMTPLQKYISNHYQEDPASYRKEIKEFESLHQTVRKVPQDFTGCSILKRYFSQLLLLQNRFPMTDDGPACVGFQWTDIYSGSTFTITDIKYEQACILYNIGALHSQLGALDARNNAEGMKMTCTHFQCAAWAFQHLRDTYPQPKGSDLSHDVLTFMMNVMLAQAQECILEKSMLDNRKSSITAKVAIQVVDYYQAAQLILVSSSPSRLAMFDVIGTKLYKYWDRYIEFKMAYYSSISHYFMGNQCEEQQKMGERVSWFQSASENLNEAIKMAKKIDREDLNESLLFLLDVIGGKHSASKKENDFVYHEKVLPVNSLPEIKGASLVKGISFNPSDGDVCGADIFARLVPMEAHSSSSVYSEEKAKVLRSVRAKIEEKNEELSTFMSSLHLDKSLLQADEEELPQELMEKCAAMSVKPTAISDLFELLKDLDTTSAKVESDLASCQNLLTIEEQKEKEHQEVFGKRVPSMITVELKKECSKLDEAHKKATDSNKFLKTVANTHVANLRVLSGSVEEVIDKLPSVNNVKVSGENENSYNEYQKLINKVEEMQKQRQFLEDQLREALLNDDITKRIVATDEKTDLQKVFEEEMGKHEQCLTYIDQNLSAQDNILHALTNANASFADVRKDLVKTRQERSNTISMFIASYEAYEDLVDKTKTGLEFYQKLKTNVSRLLDRIKSVTRVQDEERTQRCNAQKPIGGYPQTNLSSGIKNSNVAPKLKDYLPFMTGAQLPSSTVAPNLQPHAMPTYQPYNQQHPLAASGNLSPMPNATLNQSQPIIDRSSKNVAPVQPNERTAVKSMVAPEIPNSMPKEVGVYPVPNAYSQPGHSKVPATVPSQFMTPYMPPTQYVPQMSVTNTTPEYAMQTPPFSGYSSQNMNTPNSMSYATPASAMTSHVVSSASVLPPVPAAAPQTYSSAVSQNYNTAVSQSYNTAVSQNYNAAASQNYNTVASQNYNAAASQNYNAAASQNYNAAASQNYNAAASQNYNAAASQNYNAAASQNYNAAASQNYNAASQNYNAAASQNYNAAASQNYNAAVSQNYNAAASQNYNAAASQNYNAAASQAYNAAASQAYNAAASQAYNAAAYPSAHPNVPSQYSSSHTMYSADNSVHYTSYFNNSDVTVAHSTVSPITAATIANVPNYQLPTAYPSSQANMSALTSVNSQQYSTQAHVPAAYNYPYAADPSTVNQSYAQQPVPSQMPGGSTLPAYHSVAPAVSPSAYPAKQNYSVPYSVPSQAAPQMPSVSPYSQEPPTQVATVAPHYAHQSNGFQQQQEFIPPIECKPLIPVPAQSSCTPPASEPVKNASVNRRGSSASPIATSVEAPGPKLSHDKGRSSSIPQDLEMSGLKQEHKSNLEIFQIKELEKQNVLKSKGKEAVIEKDPFDDPSVLAKFSAEVDKFEKLVEGLVRKSLNGTMPLDQKWKELAIAEEKDSRKMSISVARCYPLKNRLPDIMPYDSNRVKLMTCKDDYINASFLKDLSPTSPTFIITQAPLPATYSDFWMMVWEQQVENIVCLLPSNELKTHVYWPQERGKVIVSGPLELSLQSKKCSSCFTGRIINMTHKQNKTSRVVVHLQFHDWQPSKFPDVDDLLSFVSEVLSYYCQQRSLQRPLLVHCSAGVGRSGAFCLMTALASEISGGRIPKDVEQVAARMFQQRKFVIQDRDHLQFCYYAVLCYGQKMLKKKGMQLGLPSFDDKTSLANLASSQGLTKHNIETPKKHSNFDFNFPVIDKLSCFPTDFANSVPASMVDHPASQNQPQEDTLEEFDSDTSTKQVESNDPDLDESKADGNLVSDSPVISSDSPVPDCLSEPCVISVMDPNKFTLDSTGSSGKRRITKEMFTSGTGGTFNSLKLDASDPLSKLDPLWSMKKQ